MISIICPIYNEESVLSKTSTELEKLSQRAELIFVDGGSTDRSIEYARLYGKVLYSRRGRAAQMNYGADYAKGDILLFLHADTAVSVDTLVSIERKITENSFIGGCLTQRIDNDSWIYRFIEAAGNIRAGITKVFYGDQGIFVRKEVFSKINSFPDVPIMEDVLFTRRLRRQGKTVVLADKIIVSPRRWEKRGVFKTAFLYTLINILFFLRFPLEDIRRLYEDLR